MSTHTATPHPTSHSALRRLVARHPVATFLVMAYTVESAFALPPIRTHLASQRCSRCGCSTYRRFHQGPALVCAGEGGTAI